MVRKEDILALGTRRRIYEYIYATPGAHLRKVHRAVELPFGQVLYHLNYLEKHELIVVKKDGKFNRYFVKNHLGRREKDVISVLRHNVPRRVAILLLFRPKLTHKEMLAYVDVSPSTLSFHLQKMLQVEVVGRETRGRESLYWLTDPQLTSQVLLTHRASFQCADVDRFADMWTRLSVQPAAPAPTEPPVAVPLTPAAPLREGILATTPADPATFVLRPEVPV